MSLLYSCVLWVALAVAAVPHAAAAVVGFAAEDYAILAGETLALEVAIVTNGAEPDDLFSYGVRLVPSTTDSLGVMGIDVPSDLDFSAFTESANVDSSIDVLGVKGNIELSSTPFAPYPDDLLATFSISVGAVGDYIFGLDFYRTLGANEQIFLAGDGTVLDDALTFGDTSVKVIDEADLLPDVTIERSGSSGSDMDVRFPTIRGLTYIAQRSIDLETWFDLGTGEGDGTEFLYTHVGGGTGPRNFYRVTVTTDGE